MVCKTASEVKPFQILEIFTVRERPESDGVSDKERNGF